MIKNIIRSYVLLQWWISVVTMLGHLCDVKLTRNHFTQAKKRGIICLSVPFELICIYCNDDLKSFTFAYEIFVNLSTVN